MKLKIVDEPVALEMMSNGVVRVGKTRVTLDTVISVFKQGTTPEEIVYRYPCLNLADVYSALAFYLNHQLDVEAYLEERQEQGQQIRKINEAKFDPQGLRERLIARKNQQEVC